MLRPHGRSMVYGLDYFVIDMIGFQSTEWHWIVTRHDSRRY